MFFQAEASIEDSSEKVHIFGEQARGGEGVVSLEEVVNQASAMLQRRGRLTYRMLKRHFHLDAEELEDLTFELIEGQRLAIDEDGDVLVWTGEPLAATPDAQRAVEAERRFHTLLPAVMGLLHSQRRVTYRTLTYVFSLDETLLEEIREELTFRRAARDEDRKGLVWTGEAQSPASPLGAMPHQPAFPDATTVISTAAPLPRRVTALLPPSNGPTVITPDEEPTTSESVPTPAADGSTAGAVHEVLREAPPAARVAPEAERRQLTVMFCDLADSTRLSQQLDAEDLREVVRAYQATAAAVIHQYEGHIAQYLGDGLLVYFGWPVAHEDDALRGVYAGLGLVEAITTTLNPRLEREKGVQLAVRIGLHTGPVGVGEMGGGGRHEHLATGSTQYQPYCLGLLAEAYGAGGHPDAGLTALAEALAVLDTTEVRFSAAELYRIKGALLLQQAVPDATQAAACFHQALDIARQQQAKSWELRAATSLARLWQAQDQRQDAYDLLAPVYHWFTEGFDTADLQEAQALLEEVSQ